MSIRKSIILVSVALSGLALRAEAQLHVPIGGELQWVQRAGGPLGEFASDAVCHTDGSVFVTGEFWGTALFPSAPGGSSGTSIGAVGEGDAFLARYDAQGNLMWVRRIGGLYSDRGIQVELVTSGVTRVQVRGTGFGKVVPYGSGGVQVFPPIDVRFHDEGTFHAVYTLTGVPYSIAAEAYDTFDPPSRKVELAPAFGSLEVGWFDLALPLTASGLTSAGGRDFYLAEMHPDPAPPDWKARWAIAGGGAGTDWATAVAFAGGRSVVVIGSFEQTATFPTRSGTAQTRTAADADPNDADERPDIFIARYWLNDCDLDEVPDLVEGTSGCP